MERQCSTCTFWLGDDSAYAADCGNPYNLSQRPAFDSSCGRWAPKPGAVMTTTETQAQALIDQWRAYKQAIAKGRTP